MTEKQKVNLLNRLNDYKDYLFNFAYDTTKKFLNL